MVEIWDRDNFPRFLPEEWCTWKIPEIALKGLPVKITKNDGCFFVCCLMKHQHLWIVKVRGYRLKFDLKGELENMCNMTLQQLLSKINKKKINSISVP